MARGVNKVILIGNLGADPEIRNTPNGNMVANLNLATTDTWTDRQSGQRQERTEWHRVVLFGKTAEIVGQYLRKGSRIYIEGRLQTRKWQDQNGQDRYTTQIIANDMQMLSTPQNGGQQQGGFNQQQGSYGPPQGGGYGQGQQQGAPPGQPGNPGGPYPPGGGMGGPPPNQGGGPPPNQPPNQGGGQQQGGNFGAPDPGSFDDFDDEIPF